MITPSGWSRVASEAMTSHPLCVWADELAKRQLTTGRFELTSSSVGNGGEMAAGHTAALVLVTSAQVCGGTSAMEKAELWLRWAVVHPTKESTKTTSADAPPWWEAARRLRLLGALGHVPAGMKAQLSFYASDALSTLGQWRDADGLFWSDAGRRRKGLLENIEAYVALRSAAIFSENVEIFKARG
ncbi:MAG: hypothetical protein N2Z21_07945 [Candidatus Sumerlaeaceae bacterium]|nr:hypothetical protein [Candidatus Sumerlaeaceae bacterium]